MKPSKKNNLYYNFCGRTNYLLQNCFVRSRFNTQQQLDVENQRNSLISLESTQGFQENFQNFAAREAVNLELTKIKYLSKFRKTTLSQNPTQMTKENFNLNFGHNEMTIFKYIE